jgi:hypothetical protein
MRVLSLADLTHRKHICWNEEHIAQLIRACLFPAPIHRGAWRESHIDDWLKARKAKGDLSWMRFSLNEKANSDRLSGSPTGQYVDLPELMTKPQTVQSN